MLGPKVELVLGVLITMEAPRASPQTEARKK